MSETNFDPANLNDTKTPRAERTRSTNKAGGVSWTPDDTRFGLYKNIINNLLEDTYYQDATELFEDVVDEFLDVYLDGYAKYPTQLATYARHDGGYRDIAQVLLVLSANIGRRNLKGGINPTIARRWNKQSTEIHGDIIADFAPMVIDRMDEFATVVDLQLTLFGKPVPRPLRRGIENALHKKYLLVKVLGPPYDIDPVARTTYVNDEDRQSAINRGVRRVYEQNGVDLNTEHYGVEIVDEDYVFDDYTASKYMQKNHDVSLYDVFNLVRPAPRDEDRETLFERIVRGEPEMDKYPDVEALREDSTWESERSQEDDDRSEAEQWRDALDNDMGLMARVRNLRNMLQAGLSGHEIFDYDVIDDDVYGNQSSEVFGAESERRVQEHQMFPFRYYQAYKAVADIGGFNRSGDGFEIRPNLLDEWSEEWLNSAIDASVQHLPDRFESTMTAIDLSGSMNQPVSNDSTLARAEIATLFGSIVTKYGGDVGAFGDYWETVDVDDNARQSTGTLQLARWIYSLNDQVGNSTNGWRALKWAIENEKVYDRFVFFTDEQLWDSFGWGTDRPLKDVWDEYRDQVNPDAHLYVIDLASYGDLTMPQDDHHVHQISGWNPEVIDFIDKNESAQDVIDQIAEIEPGDY